MKLCFSQVTIGRTSTAEAVEAAARAGFGHIDLWWPRVSSELDATSAIQIRERCESEGILPASLSGVKVELAGIETEWKSTFANFRSAAEFAEAVGIPIVTIDPGTTQETQADRAFGLAVSRIGSLLELTDQVSISLALEFRADSRWLASLPTTQAIIEMIGSDRLGICFDSFHYYCGPSKLEDLNKAAIRRIRSIQLSDLIASTREFAEEAERILPGEGDFDLRSILGCLRSADYDGLICVEAPNPMLWQFAPDRVADMAHQSLLRFFASDESADES